MAAPKGHARYGGRTKGTPNKTTKALKEMIEGALADLGGQKWLVSAAKENPAAFMTLLGKILPKDVNLQGEVKHSLADLVTESMRMRQQQEDRPH